MTKNNQLIIGVIIAVIVILVLYKGGTPFSIAGTTCYQESADTVNQGGLDTPNCNLNYSGSYVISGSISRLNNCLDGVWNESVCHSSSSGNIDINYIKPSGAVSATIKSLDAEYYPNPLNHPIPSSCFNALSNIISIRVKMEDATDFGQWIYCLNSTGWELVNYAPDDPSYYEEAIIWDIAPTCTPNCAGKCGGVPDGCGGTCNADCIPCVPNWQTGDWSSCINSIQTRNVIDLNSCVDNTNKPVTSRTCTTTTTNTSCTPNWQISSWSTCSNGQQTRTITDNNNCGVGTNLPTSQTCESEKTYFGLTGETWLVIGAIILALILVWALLIK